MDCLWLSHGISIEKHSLHDCCLLRGPKMDGNPFIMDLDENNMVDWDTFFEKKRTLKEKKIHADADCKGCKELYSTVTDYDFWEKEEFISFINFNHWNICNSNCIYCTKEYNGGDNHFNVLPLIKSLASYKDGSYFRKSGVFTFQGGEATMLPEFEELFDFILKYSFDKIRIHSSGIKYSNAIARALKEDKTTIIVSPDSAIKETYEKIKRVKAFDLVWNNLKEYASFQKCSDNVKVKFIIIPEVNDNKTEIDAFLNKLKEIKVNNVIWDVESQYSARNQYKLPYICELLDYALDKAQKLNIVTEYYDSATYILRNRKNLSR